MRPNYRIILEYLHSRGDSNINESGLSPVEKKIKKIFGKMKVRETWQSEGAEEPKDESMYKTKFFQINTYRCEIDSNELLNALKDKTNLTLDKILRTIYKITGKKFHVLTYSDMRIIFEADKKARSYIELKYNKKALEKDSFLDTEDGEEKEDNKEATKKEEPEVDMTLSKEEIEEFDKAPSSEKQRMLVEKANIYKSKDVGQIPEKIAFVSKNTSVEPQPFVKKEADVDAISKQAGVDKEVAEQASEYSDDLFTRASKEEPNITDDLVSSIKSVGGTMYGLKARMKQPTSLGRKIASDAYDTTTGFKGDLAKAASAVKDSVRFTAILPIESFVEGYFSIKSELEGKGYTEVRCKNFYISFSKGTSQQKAVQCVYTTASGLYFELQFHTKESQGAKEVNHPLYERYRSSESSSMEKGILDMRMRTISEEVPDPEGVFDIQTHG